MLHEKKTLHEDLKRMGLGMDGEVRNGGGEASINESVMDDIRKAIDKKIADIKGILSSMALKKSEAERALQIVKERFASINVCDFIDDSSCPVRGKTESLGEAEDEKSKTKLCGNCRGVLRGPVPSDAVPCNCAAPVELKESSPKKITVEFESGDTVNVTLPSGLSSNKEDISGYLAERDSNGKYRNIPGYNKSWGNIMGYSKNLKEAYTDPECDICRKPAVVNYQKVWVKYDVTPKGEYDKPTTLDNQDPFGEENLHYCRAHAEENRPV